jgi:SAM-dependent methyltransferase
LKREGYVIVEVDPNVNGMTLLDYYLEHGADLSSFDLILSVSVLEHVQDDVQFVRLIGELLKPGGTAILTVDFAEAYKPGLKKPIVDHRLYTTERICDVLVPALGNCALLDLPKWSEGVEDFEYEGVRYGFATLVFRKLDEGIVGQAAVAPVWSEILKQGPSARNVEDKMTNIRRLFRFR